MHYSRYFYRDSFFLDMWNFGELYAKKNKRQHDALDASTKIGSKPFKLQPKKSADISRRYKWFPREMTSDQRSSETPS